MAERLPSFASDLAPPRTKGWCALALCLLYKIMDGWWPVPLTTGWRGADRPDFVSGDALTRAVNRTIQE
jgi:hypothetical protein